MEMLISRSEFESLFSELCLKSVVLTLNETSEHAESEIGDRLIFWLSDIAQSIDLDHVSLRRRLVDERYLEREKSGAVSIWPPTSHRGKGYLSRMLREWMCMSPLVLA
tara:strand:+ start:138 stop:461 length:324 start_codon:yes stop_codon:yes gene_type:complete